MTLEDFKNGQYLLIDKPLTWSSFAVVKRVRNIICKKFNEKKIKVGHAGTLDPLATGLLILCTGKMTKSIEEFQAQEKEYIAQIRLGATTPSFDGETQIDKESDYSYVTEEIIKNSIKKFIGDIDQIPPTFSAKYIDGERAYKKARTGETVIMKSNKIKISSIEILEINLPYVSIKVNCGKGTYIRSLANDIGKDINCGAYLTELRRTKIGKFDVENAVSLENFAAQINISIIEQ